MQESLFSTLHTADENRGETFQPPYYIGTGGWNYSDWLDNFYPSYLDSSRWIEFYATKFSAIEIDSTFYNIPRESSVMRWRDLTPDEFTFTAKVPRIITHEKQLDPTCYDILLTFIKRMSILGQKLGPILLQFPPSFSPGYFERLHDFLPQLPADFRFALEIRDPRWLTQDFYSLLHANNVALTLVDSARMPKKSVITADFTYIRWLGDSRDHLTDFSSTQIDRTSDLRNWAAVMVKKFQKKNLDIYGFFNNHYAGYSPGSIELLYSLVSEIN